MEKPEEAAAEAEPQRRRGLASKEKEASFSDSFSSAWRRPEKSFVSTGNRPQKTTGTDGLKPGGRRGAFLGDGVANPRIGHGLHPGIDEADLAGAKLVDRVGFGEKTPTRSTTRRRFPSCESSCPCGCGPGARAPVSSRRGRRHTSCRREAPSAAQPRRPAAAACG